MYPNHVACLFPILVNLELHNLKLSVAKAVRYPLNNLLHKSLVYIKNKIGPSTDFCKTLHLNTARKLRASIQLEN